MKWNRWTALTSGIGLALLVAVLALSTRIDAQDKKAPDRNDDKKPARGEADSPFAGKILMIYEKGDASPILVMETVSFTEIKGVRFLTGKCVDREGDAMGGLKACLAFDNVGAVIEFETLEAYKEYEAKESEKMNAIDASGILPPNGAPRPLRLGNDE
jgi:hypothetical protein